MKEEPNNRTIKHPSGLLALDPATHITGYAFFNHYLKHNEPVFWLQYYGLVKSNDKDWNMRCLEINSKLRNFIIKNRPIEMTLEFPAYQSGSRGYNAARQGDTLKLAFLCGKIVCGWELYVANMMKSYNMCLPMPTLYTPQQWKGQCTKEITAKRCEKKFGVGMEKKIDDNFLDAIMIGYHWVDKKGYKLDIRHEEIERRDL